MATVREGNKPVLLVVDVQVGVMSGSSRDPAYVPPRKPHVLDGAPG